MEAEVKYGITEYVFLGVPSFTGIFKGYYMDFVVNEIRPNSGNIIHLDHRYRPAVRPQAPQPAVPTTPHQNRAEKLSFPISSQPSLPTPSGSTAPESASPNHTPPPQPTRKVAPPHLRLPGRQQKSSDQDSPTKVQNTPPHLRLSGGQQKSSEQGSLSTQSSPFKMNEADTGVRITTRHVIKYKDGELKVVSENGIPVVPDSETAVSEAMKSEGAPAEPSTAKTAEKRIPYASQVGTKTVGGWLAFSQSKGSTTTTNGSQIPQVDGAKEIANAVPSSEEISQKLTLSIQDRRLFNESFDDQAVEQMLELYRQRIDNPTKHPNHFPEVKSTRQTAREGRFKLHDAVRRVFCGQLNSTTDGHGFIHIVAKYPTRISRNTASTNAGSRWDKLGGEYVHFTLCKENMEHNEALSSLARAVHIPRQAFGTAGTKDKRGITVQRVSAYRVDINRLIQAAGQIRNIWIGDFEHQRRGLQEGDLHGNQFEITLRDCQFSGSGGLEAGTEIERARASVDAAVRSLLSHGFLNYYGLQRFGTHAVGTQEIGRSLLQEDFKSACEGVLAVDHATLAAAQQGNASEIFVPQALRDRALALHIFATTGESREALAQLPYTFRSEISIIRHLSQTNHENDFQGAMAMIERGTRSRYAHAYQSLVWNFVASARWRLYGNRVVPGDLVLADDHPDSAGVTSTNAASNDTLAVDQDGEPIVQAKAEDRAYGAIEIFARARHVTASEIEMPGCELTIFDVVLPLPGYDVLYPANASGHVYKDYMGSKEGGHLDPHDMRRSWRDISLAGAYRKLLSKPLGTIEWDVKAYGSNGDEQFVDTDLDRLGIPRHSPSEPVTHYRQPLQRNDIQQNPLSWLNTSPNAAWDVKANDPRRLVDATDPNDPASGPAGAEENKKPTYASWDVRSEDQSWGTTNDSTFANAASSADNGSVELASASASASGDAKAATGEKDDKIAVILKFSLGPGVYATMALRELMKEGGVLEYRGRGSQ
ncbi:MAG: hypothetical protein Q9212_002385 [Teloschistes hypoglaucus]